MASIREALQRGLEHQRQGQLAEAEKIYRQVLQAEPLNVDALHLLGVLADQVDKHELAVQYITQAIRLQGNHAAFHANLGLAYRKLGKQADALAASRQALRLDPCLGDAHTNIGTVLQSQGRLDEALKSYSLAIDLRGDDTDAHYNRALAWLSTGEFARGWAEYEWRWRRPDFYQPPMPRPRWDGTSLAGRTLLVQCEQGLGDTMQFVRYMKLLESQGEKTILVPQLPLVPLLSGSGVQGILPPGSPMPPFDVYAPLLSLPHFLGTTLETIPGFVPYLKANNELAAHWRARLKALGGFTIGIHWQGNPKSPLEPARSIPLAAFERLAMPGVTLVSLQKGFGSEQLVQLGGRFAVVDLSGELDEADGPFMDTAALMSALDLVVTSDTVTAHLGGALGTRVWVGLAHVADWRWLLARDDSPWYPTMRLFRQAQPGNWSEVFERMAGELAPLVAP